MEHGTLYRYISVRKPSADNSSSLGSKLISSNAPTYDFYLRELLRSELLTYLLTYLLTLRPRAATLRPNDVFVFQFLCLRANRAGALSDAFV